MNFSAPKQPRPLVDAVQFCMWWFVFVEFVAAISGRFDELNGWLRNAFPYPVFMFMIGVALRYFAIDAEIQSQKQDSEKIRRGAKRLSSDPPKITSRKKTKPPNRRIGV